MINLIFSSPQFILISWSYANRTSCETENCCVLYYLFRSGIFLYISALAFFAAFLSNNRVLLPARQFSFFCVQRRQFLRPRKMFSFLTFRRHTTRTTTRTLSWNCTRSEVNIYIHPTMRRSDNAKTRRKNKRK